jgi:hypothetical protein
MRLTDLSPSWLKVDGFEGVGIKFLCPCCRKSAVYVLFLNTLSGVPSISKGVEVKGQNWGNRWSRSGMTFEDLSLSPDVDAKRAGHGRWTVLDGEVTEVVALR